MTAVFTAESKQLRVHQLVRGKDTAHPAVRQHSAVRSSNVLMHLENSHKKWFVWFQPHEVSRTAVLWRQELGWWLPRAGGGQKETRVDATGLGC